MTADLEWLLAVSRRMADVDCICDGEYVCYDHRSMGILNSRPCRDFTTGGTVHITEVEWPPPPPPREEPKVWIIDPLVAGAWDSTFYADLAAHYRYGATVFDPSTVIRMTGL